MTGGLLRRAPLVMRYECVLQNTWRNALIIMKVVFEWLFRANFMVIDAMMPSYAIPCTRRVSDTVGRREMPVPVLGFGPSI